MRRLLTVLVTVVVALLGVTIGAGSDAARAVPSATCQAGAVAGVVGGKRVCLKLGQSCRPALDARYHRYGFHCHAPGRLTRLTPVAPAINPKIAISGPEQMVYDYSTSACSTWDIPDGPAKAIRSADGQVQIPLAHEFTRRMVGPDFDHLTHDCSVVLQSGKNGDPAAYDDGDWLFSPYTTDGQTVYALVHHEYHADQYGSCKFAQWSNGCNYWTTLLAVSTDGGRSYHHAAAPNDLVATIPTQYGVSTDPNWWQGAGVPTNIVHGPGGFYYTLVSVHDDQVGVQGVGVQGSCLLRTNSLAQAQSWRGWDGNSFTVRFIDPYIDTTSPRTSHICQPPTSLEQSGEFGPTSLTYSTYFHRYLLVGEGSTPPTGTRQGFYFTTSTDLLHWSQTKLIAEEPLVTRHQCTGGDTVQYPSVIDPASASRSFETVGQTAYLYYSRAHWDAQGCYPTSDRDLVRVPITITK